MLYATSTLTNSIQRLDGDLKLVGGLNNDRANVGNRRDKLYLRLNHKLAWIIYREAQQQEPTGKRTGNNSSLGLMKVMYKQVNLAEDLAEVGPLCPIRSLC